jgi:hypothetical protein
VGGSLQAVLPAHPLEEHQRSSFELSTSSCAPVEMSLAVGHDHLDLEGVGLEQIPPSIGWATGQLCPFSPIVTDGHVHKIQCATKSSCDAGVTDVAVPACLFGAFTD